MGEAKPHVGLFVTCLVDAIRPGIGFAALKLLEDAGCEVSVPRAQTCCGQPAYNSGYGHEAVRVASVQLDALARGLEVRLDESAIPVRDPVRSVCEILGYDPLFLACEGRVVAVVAPDQADQALAAWQALPEGREAALLGTLAAGDPLVILDTELGGSRILEQLEDDPLPRIC